MRTTAIDRSEREDSANHTVNTVMDRRETCLITPAAPALPTSRTDCRTRVKQAGITTPKSLSDFDWTYNPKLPKTKLAALASGRFVQAHGGVLLIGPPGVGKSHCAVALAVGAIKAGHRALVRSTFDLVADFAEADATGM